MSTSVEKVNVELNAKDNASKNVKKLTGATQALKTAVKGMAIAFATVKLKQFITESIELYKVQEKAEARLEAGVKNLKDLGEGYENNVNGVYSLTQELKDYAKELQSITTFGDEQIISAEAMLSTFQLSGKEIKSLTPSLLDMASAMEKTSGQQADLNDLAIAMGKAMTTGAGALGRYGITLTDVQKAQFNLAQGAEKTAILVDILNSNFAGTAEELRKTTAGALQSAKNDWGDFKETVGALLAPLLADIAEFISSMAILLQEQIGIIKERWTADWKGVRTAFTTAWNGIKLALQLAWSVIEFIFINMKASIIALQTTFSFFFSDQDKMWGDYGTMIKAIVIGAVESLNWLIQKLEYAIKMMQDFQLGASLGDTADFNSKFPSPTITRDASGTVTGVRASGGRVNAGESYVVGEHRPELYTPAQGGRIQPNTGGGNITLSGVFGKDAVEEIGDMLIQRFQLSSKVV